MSTPIRANLVLNMLFFKPFRKYIYIYIKFSLICSCFVVAAIVSKKKQFFKIVILIVKRAT